MTRGSVPHISPFSGGHGYFKPCRFPRNAGLPDTDARDVEDLFCQEEAEPGVLPDPFGKDPLLHIRRDALAVVLVDDVERAAVFLAGNRYF